MPVKIAKAWTPAPYELADLSAVQALAAGTADEQQQKRALDWIIKQVCGTYELSYHPESDRDTAFAEGRRFAGLQIVKALYLQTGLLRKVTDK
jgi:hypothetical protein